MAEFLMEDGEMVQPENVRLSEDGKAVVILDQTQLPNVTEFLTLDTPKKMYDAIFELQVRGAPAIGICAGYCMYVLSGQIAEETKDYEKAFGSRAFKAGFRIGK